MSDEDEAAARSPARDLKLARALLAARDGAGETEPPTLRRPGFALDDAYRVAALLDRRLTERGHRQAGWKVGFTNQAIWPELGIDEPIMAPVYESGLRMTGRGDGAEALQVPLDGFRAPRLELEVVFGCEEDGDPAWVALGIEVVDCHYPDWRLTPADAVADFGLHGALIVGPRVTARREPRFHAVLGDLDRISVRLTRVRDPDRGGAGIAVRGRGRDVLGHPLAALDFARGWVARSAGGAPLVGAVSTGTLVELVSAAPGERWRAESAGGELPPFEVRLTE